LSIEFSRGAERTSGRRPLAAALFLVSLSGLFASPGPQDFPEAATIPVEEIRAGMRGYGLSVFKGTVPERFEVEVLGISRNQKPDGSYILARLSGQNLEKSGVIAGMSGSPVYFEGRLAGAVAFTWPFATEPIAGITPIASMRAIASGPSSADPWSLPAMASRAGSEAGSVASRLDEIVSRIVPAGRVDEELARFARAVSNDGRSALLWGASGFDESSHARLARSLSLPGLSLGTPAGAGGGTDPAIDSDLGPGSSVAALFIDGDLRLAATGTVTDRIGDRLLAFGHPVLGISEISMPLATSEVITVMPSALSSFKLSNSGLAVGTFERDHVYGSLGRVGPVARTVPLTVRVLAPLAPLAPIAPPARIPSPSPPPASKLFELRLADIPEFLPALAAMGSLGAWDVAAGTGGMRSLELGLRVELTGRPPLVLSQWFEGSGASGEALGYLLSVLSYLSRNEFAPVTLGAIEVEVRLSAEPRAATLEAVRPSRTRLAPGDVLDLQIDARAWNGEAVRWTERTVMPSGLPEGRYTLLVGDGGSADGARLALAPAPPTSLEQVLALLRGLHSARDLVVLGVLPGPGLSTGGEILPRLPGSMRSIWGAAGSRAAVQVRNAVVQNEAHRRERPLAGLIRVDVEIRRRTVPSDANEGKR
jgi:hypothetical protein